MKKPDWILALAAKRVGILGAGKEGRAVADFLRAQGCQQVEVFDDEVQGHRPLASSGECELVLRSPGVRPRAVMNTDVAGASSLLKDNGRGERMSASHRSDLFRPEASNERGEGNAESLQGGGELPSPLKNQGGGNERPRSEHGTCFHVSGAASGVGRGETEAEGMYPHEKPPTLGTAQKRTTIIDKDGEGELPSPGVRPRAALGRQAVGIAELFLRHCPSKHIIGVTGTKGKGTTCGILGAAARAARRRVHVCGNIGVPFFSVFADIQPDDLVVAELSSFQLWDAQTAPQVAVVLGISPDHLDMHADMTDYLNAKKNLVRGAGAGSQIIFCADSPSARAVAAAAGAGAKRIPFSARRRQMKSGAYLHQAANGQRYFALQEEGTATPKLICAAAEGGLLGAGLGGPNTENTLAALAAGAASGIPEVALAEGIRQFSGFAGRMEKLCTGQNGVSAWNDTAATTPEAAAGAVQTFSALEMPFLLICGGRAKVAGAGALAHQAAKSRWLRGVWCTGECGKTFAADMLAAGVSAHLVHEEQDMQTATKKACGAARPGHHVLLSPGAASFDAFPNATIRGQTFAHICAQELGADFALRKKV